MVGLGHPQESPGAPPAPGEGLGWEGTCSSSSFSQPPGTLVLWRHPGSRGEPWSVETAKWHLQPTSQAFWGDRIGENCGDDSLGATKNLKATVVSEQPRSCWAASIRRRLPWEV